MADDVVALEARKTMDDGLSFILKIALVFALVFANGFFVAAEFALVSVRRTRIEELVAQGRSNAKAVRAVIRDPDRFIAATQLGITIASLGLGWVGEPFFANLIEPWFHVLPPAWVGVASHSVAVAISFTLITFMHVVIGELMPKSIALQFPEQVSLIVAQPTRVFETLFRPAIVLLNGTGNTLLRWMGVPRAAGHHLIHSVEELKMLVTASQVGGVLEESEEEMIHKVFGFGERQVSEAMVPRPDIVGIESNASIGDFLGVFAESRHSRYPVYEGNLDNIVGFVAIKDVLNFMAAEGPGSRQKPITTLIRPALVVPEFKHVGDLFEEMQAQGTPFAVIVDEYGGTAGIVTQGSILEVIVGRLSDETLPEGPQVSQLDEHTAEVDAHLRIEEVNEELRIELPDNDAYETLAGLILYHVQRIPKVGDHLALDNVKLTVKEMKGPKIEKIEVKRVDTPKAPADAMRNGAKHE